MADDFANALWRRFNHIVVKPLMRSLMVVMKTILSNTILQMRLAKNKHSIQAF